MKLDTYRISSHRSLEALGLQQGAPSDSGRNSEFRAVEGGSETMSGETLLVEAYAALWIILFGFVFLSWRKQARIDARVAELERAVARGHGK
jgi:CcmD family protein